MTRHVLHVGFPKAGSTFLQSWFAAHPDIACREGAFAGLTGVRGVVTEGLSGEQPRLCRVTSAEELSAPFDIAGPPPFDWTMLRRTPEAGARICRILHTLFPSASVLIVTRGFRTLLPSAYSEYVRMGGTLGLEIFVRDYLPAIYDYDRVVTLYREAFGAGRVLVLPWELLRDDPAAFRMELETLLGVSGHPFPPLPANPSPPPGELLWYRAVSRAILAAPAAAGIRRRLMSAHLRSARLRRPIAPRFVLARLERGSEQALAVSDSILEPFRGKAECLRDSPLHRPFLADYLL